MDDRDKDLTGLFVRDLDDIPLPARGAWRRVSGREPLIMRASRSLLAAAAVIAVLAIALIVGLQLAQRQTAAPSSSPSATASAAAVVTASPSPASSTLAPTGTPVAPVGIYNDDFGFAINQVGTVATIQPGATATIRKESSNATIGSFQHQYFAVSPDGTQIAYWTVKSPGEQSRLQIASAANPQSLGASSGLGTDENGAIIIWANDSSAVAYVVLRAGVPPTTTIRTMNARGPGGGPGQAVITSTDSTKPLQPLAWDRAANLLAVGVGGNGGFMTEYIVASTATPQAAPKRTAVSGRITVSSVRPSSDAKLMVGTDIDSGFSYWPLGDYGAKVTPAESKYGLNGALWRPGTHEIGFIGPSDQFWLCDADRNTPLGCGRTAFSGVPAGATVRLFRVDGNAVLLAGPGTGGAPTTYTLVKISNDPLAAKATGGDRVTFTEASGLNASVRLR